jgi:bacterioferritin-associated ferredoxin
MIVCSCNVFTDHDVRTACTAPTGKPRTAGQVYGCLGCSAQCGRCARTIKKIMDEALAGACPTSCACCPHAADHQA